MREFPKKYLLQRVPKSRIETIYGGHEAKCSLLTEAEVIAYLHKDCKDDRYYDIVDVSEVYSLTKLYVKEDYLFDKDGVEIKLLTLSAAARGLAFKGFVRDDGSQIMTQRSENDSNWTVGEMLINGILYQYNVKHFEEPSVFGYGNGKASKIWIHQYGKGCVFNFDRGHDLDIGDTQDLDAAETASAQAALDMLLDFYN